MTDSLLMAVHAFASCVLMFVSVGDTLLPTYSLKLVDKPIIWFQVIIPV